MSPSANSEAIRLGYSEVQTSHAPTRVTKKCFIVTRIAFGWIAPFHSSVCKDYNKKIKSEKFTVQKHIAEKLQSWLTYDEKVLLQYSLCQSCQELYIPLHFLL